MEFPLTYITDIRTNIFQFVGCPFPYCRKPASNYSDVLGLFDYGFIVRDCYNLSSNGSDVLCSNCERDIGFIENGRIHLECYFYIEMVGFGPLIMLFIRICDHFINFVFIA